MLRYGGARMTMSLPPLYLMRHGETAWNVAGRLQGRGDSALTPLGERQAGWLAALTREVPGRRLSSPLGRADRTARIAFGSDYTHDARLVEICVGEFAGRSLADLRRLHPALFDGAALDWYDRCPGGEGHAALAARCRAFLTDLRGPTLAVTHGVTLSMLRGLALGRPLSDPQAGAVLQGGIHEIRDGAERLHRHPDDF